MGTNHKQFKPFDKVLVRYVLYDGNTWVVDLYSHYSYNHHVCVGMSEVRDNDILPFEGNEHLVGTTNEPEEEISLKRGECLMVIDKIDLSPCTWELRYFSYTDETRFRTYYIETQKEERSCAAGWKYAVRFSDFNPYDMEETKKHILCVRNSKIIKYQEL